MANDSGTDLAQLEYEFATNPNSEAFIPLAEAYLKMGRFVEAMVVCKKGIKAHPELPTGRLIMARIYSDQAKHQKAIDELNSLLKLSPQNAEAFRLLGLIHLKLGRNEEGVDFLKKTLDANPEDAEARDELLKRGIDYAPAVAEPEPEPEPEPAPAPAPVETGNGGAAAGAPATPLSERPTQREMNPVPPADTVPPRRTTQPGLPAARPAAQAVRRPAGPPKKRIADIFQEMEAADKQPQRKGFKYTLIMGGVLVVGLIIYVLYTWQAGLKQEEINKNLEEGRARFNRDTYAGYKAALDNYRAIYKLDKANPEALSRGAFIVAALVGEHGEDRALLAEGEKYLREAMAIDQTSTMHEAAAAMIGVYAGGSQADAIKGLEKALKDQPESAILHTTLGLILMEKGDLSQAKEHLLKGAQQTETRALVGLGEYSMRRSLYREAAQFFNRGLQSDNGHVRSLLGVATASLVRGAEEVYVDMAKKLLERFDKELAVEASEKDKKLAQFLGLVAKSRERKQRKTALSEIDAMLKQEGGNDLFHFIAAREHRRLGQYKKAAELIQKALRINSSRPDYVLEEAAIFLAMKDYEAARARALRVQRMDAESGQSMLLAGDAYLGEKNWDKAKEYYEKCRDFDDVSAIAHLKLGELFLTQPKSDRDLAQAEFEEAVGALSQVGERRRAAEAAGRLAKIYIEKNRAQEFVTVLQKAMTIDPSYAPPYALIAINQDLETADGKTAAKENCAKNLELDPKNEYAEACRKLLKTLR